MRAQCGAVLRRRVGVKPEPAFLPRDTRGLAPTRLTRLTRPTCCRPASPACVSPPGFSRFSAFPVFPAFPALPARTRPYRISAVSPRRSCSWTVPVLPTMSSVTAPEGERGKVVGVARGRDTAVERLHHLAGTFQAGSQSAHIFSRSFDWRDADRDACLLRVLIIWLRRRLLLPHRNTRLHTRPPAWRVHREPRSRRSCKGRRPRRDTRVGCFPHRSRCSSSGVMPVMPLSQAGLVAVGSDA